PTVLPGTCGDGVATGEEVCDGVDLRGQTCVSLGFTGGTLACLAACNGFDSTNCVLPTTPPPDPATIAPPINQTVATDLASATAFLSSGNNRIQYGVGAGTIDVKRAAVLRGVVLDRASAPIPDAQITVLNHPEYGSTLSRADGRFDMVVNGGGLLTVNYVKS